MKSRKIIFLIVIIIIAIVAGRRIIQGSKKSGTGKFSGAKTVPVATVHVKSETIEDILLLTGDVHGWDEAKVYPKVSGRLAQKIHDVGDLVKKDEVVAKVDRNEPAMEFALSEVTSPLTGVLTRYFLNIGENVNQSVPICEVADISSVKVIVHVIERDLSRVHESLEALFRVDQFPDYVFHGAVSKIDNALDTATRSANVEISSQNQGNRLKPGTFARVELILARKKNALVVPRKAVREAGEEKSVFVIAGGGVAHFKKVKVGIIQGERVEILEGVSASEQVVTVGWYNLTDGIAVDVVEKENESK